MAADLMNDTISHVETIADVYLRQLRSPFYKEKKTEYPQPEKSKAAQIRKTEKTNPLIFERVHMEVHT